VGWYFYYVRGRVPREGAIYHTFARLGQRRYPGLDLELRGIVKERGLRDEDPFDEVVARAAVVDAGDGLDFRAICERAAGLLSRETGLAEDELRAGFLGELEAGVVPVARGAAIPHLRAHHVEHPEMVLVRSRAGVPVEVAASDPGRLVDPTAEPETRTTLRVHAIFFLLSPEGQPGQHLRLLGHLATHVDDQAFMEEWLAATDDQQLRESLLREERSASLHLSAGGPTGALIGQRILDLRFPEETLVAMIRREGRTVVPHGRTVLQEGDRLTVIGDPAAIRALARQYGAGRTPAD
jgi:APA family basic amino acid/polyamine antiporter